MPADNSQDYKNYLDEEVGAEEELGDGKDEEGGDLFKEEEYLEKDY